jgi:hypothetical protein
MRRHSGAVKRPDRDDIVASSRRSGPDLMSFAPSSTRIALSTSIPITGSPVAHDSMTAGGDAKTMGRIRFAGPLPKEPEVGETVRLPDIVLTARPEESEPDAVSGALTYNGTTRLIPGDPSILDFGATAPGTFQWTGTNVTRDTDSFRVVSTLTHDVTFQICAEKGPLGQRRVESDSSPVISQRNYEEIATDLTPDAKLDYNAPPRRTYWSRRLTIIHEQFHADENVALSKEGLADAELSLSGEQTDSAADITTRLLPLALTDVKAHRDAGMTLPGREVRAYAAGNTDYFALAAAIRTKGKRDGYQGGKFGEAPEKGSEKKAAGGRKFT